MVMGLSHQEFLVVVCSTVVGREPEYQSIRNRAGGIGIDGSVVGPAVVFIAISSREHHLHALSPFIEHYHCGDE